MRSDGRAAFRVLRRATDSFLQLGRADYEGVGHGFAIRGDPKDEHTRKAADDAFVQSVNFIKSNL